MKTTIPKYWLLLLILIPVINAEALSRSDIDVLDSELASLKQRNIEIDSLLQAQRETISQKIILVDQAREDTRNAEAGESWESLRNLDAIKKKYEDSKISLSDARKHLTSLLNDKNNNIKRINQIENEIPQIENTLKRMVPFDQSSIVKLIGIEYSKTCIILIQNGNTDCPPLNTIQQLDSSNQEISGMLVSDPVKCREKSKYDESYKWYQFDSQPRIIVCPHDDMAQRIKMIIIVNNLDTYLTNSQMKKIGDQREVSKYRFVDANCKNAVIGANTWKETLPDTIQFMRYNCDEKFTNYQTIFTIDDPVTEQNIATSFKYKHDTWEETVKESHKELKINNDNTVNKSVTEDKAPKYQPPIKEPFDYAKFR